jgi:hypothetical protein
MQYYNDNNDNNDDVDDVDDVGDRMGAKGMTWTCLLEMHSLPACQRGLYFLLFFVDFFCHATANPMHGQMDGTTVSRGVDRIYNSITSITGCSALVSIEVCDEGT